MTGLLNCFLRYCSAVATRAMLTFCKSCLCTGRSFCLVYYYIVIKLWINVCLRVRFVATVALCGKCRNFLLRCYNLVTYRAMRTLGKTGFCAGRSFCFVCYRGVRDLLNRLFLPWDFLAAIRAVYHVIVASVSLAGCGYFIFPNSCCRCVCMSSVRASGEHRYGAHKKKCCKENSKGFFHSLSPV